jgi:hypothetical protein
LTGSIRPGQAMLDGEQQAKVGWGIGRRLATDTGRDVEQAGRRALNRWGVELQTWTEASESRSMADNAGTDRRRRAGSAVSRVASGVWPGKPYLSARRLG